MEDELRKMLEGVLSMPDTTGWKQVGKLTPEELLLKRAAHIKADQAAREYASLEAKKTRINAQMREVKYDFWTAVHKNHSLPKANYTLTDDGRILVQPGSVERD